MPIAFVTWGIICALFGIVVLPQVTAFHELEAGVAFVLATLSFGFAALIQVMRENAAREEQTDTDKRATSVTMSSNPTLLYCPNCNAMLEEWQARCEECGMRIDGQSDE